MHGRPGDIDVALQRLLDGVHAAAEFGQKGRMDIDDAASKRFQERSRVYAVVAGIDHELDAVGQEEVAHRDVPLLLGREPLQRKLAERDASLTGKSGAATRRPVGRHRDHVELSIEQVAEVGTFTRDDDTQPHRGPCKRGPREIARFRGVSNFADFVG